MGIPGGPESDAAKEQAWVSKSDFMEIVAQVQAQGIKIELPASLGAGEDAVLSVGQSVGSGGEAAQGERGTPSPDVLALEVVQLQTRLTAAERKVLQLSSAVTQLLDARQALVGQVAQASDVEALRDWVAEELTKLRGQEKATHATCMDSIQRAEDMGKALVRMQQQQASEQREEGHILQQDLMQQLDQQGHRLHLDMERNVRQSVHEALQQDAKWEQRLQALARGQEQLKDDLNRLRGEVRAPGMMSNGKPAAFAPHPPPTKFLHKQDDGIVWTSRYHTRPDPPQPASKINVEGARLKLPKVNKVEAQSVSNEQAGQVDFSNDLKALALRDFSVPHISSYLKDVAGPGDIHKDSAAPPSNATSHNAASKLHSEVVNGMRMGGHAQKKKASGSHSHGRHK